MKRSRSSVLRTGAVLAMFAGIAACEVPEEVEPRSESPGSVTSTTATSTTATSTTSTGTTATATTSPEVMLPPLPVPMCGDGILDPGETCDDGNLTNLDACDSACQFEQVVRFTALRLRFTVDTFCRQNAIGTAIGSAAQETVQSSIAAAI